MKKLLLSLPLVFVIVACEPNYASQANNPPKEELDAARARRDEAIAIYQRANGEWDKMSPEDRARIIELSNGDERMAQMGWPALGRMPRN